MHTVVSARPVVTCHRDHVDALFVHAGKVVLGGSRGAVYAYRLVEDDGVLDEEASRKLTTPSSMQHASPKRAKESAAAEEEQIKSATRPTWAVRLSKTQKSVEKLEVIREANLLVSLCDSSVGLHELSVLPQFKIGAEWNPFNASKTEDQLPLLPLEHSIILSQTKGALTFAIDTSVQKGILRDDSNNVFGAQNKRFMGSNAISKAYRPSDATLGKKFGSLMSTTHRTLPIGLRGMEDLQRDKEEKQKWSTINARLALASQSSADGAATMTLVSTLAVACRRKLIVFRWVDGTFWDTKEVALPHTPRSLAFPSPTTLYLGYSTTEYAILTIPLASSSSVVNLSDFTSLTSLKEIPASSTSGPRVDLFDWRCQGLNIPLLTGSADLRSKGVGSPSAAQAAVHGNSSGGMAAMAGAAFGGLGGYIGMGSKGKPLVAEVEQGEVLVCREGETGLRLSMGVFLNEEGKPTRRDGLEWRGSPEEVVYLKPYLYALFPSGSDEGGPNSSWPHVQIRSASTLVAVQTVVIPSAQPEGSLHHAVSAPSIRLLTPSSRGKGPIFVAVTPSERGTQERDGSMIWRLDMKSWAKQVDELVDAGEYQEALALLDSIDEILMEDKAERRSLVVGLYAVSLFVAGKYDEAIEIFIELDANPARVIALYPPEIAGSLARGSDEWFQLFGGRHESEASDRSSASESIAAASHPAPLARDRSRLTSLFGRRPQSVAEVDSRLGSGLTRGPFAPVKGSGAGIDDVSSIQPMKIRNSVEAQGGPVITKQDQDKYRQSTDALGRFLADRRRIFRSLLETRSSIDHHHHHRASPDDEWILQIPSRPLEYLDRQELIAVAQTVDTALFKTFLFTKPALLGPLCRLENWCEVNQVEELLLERKRFSELIALYGTKELHGKALDLLRRLSAENEDVEGRLGPTIRYLQSLGPEHINLILESSHWVLAVDSRLGMEIFTADAGKVSLLPRMSVVAGLEKFSEDLCLQYLRHLIYATGEGDPILHEKLALMLLKKSLEPEGAEERKSNKEQLLDFLRSSHHYRTERILSRLPADNCDLFEVRALLLGRLGQHEGALSIYVLKLGDHEKAEAYCVRTYEEGHADDVFLTLLRIYLRTNTESVSNSVASPMQAQAISLITRYGARIDSVAALEILPANVNLSEFRRFAGKALQRMESTRNYSAVARHVLQERALQTHEASTQLQSRRVKITEARICRRCSKRLGNSIVAVNTGGDVYHYSCR